MIYCNNWLKIDVRLVHYRFIVVFIKVSWESIQEFHKKFKMSEHERKTQQLMLR